MFLYSHRHQHATLRCSQTPGCYWIGGLVLLCLSIPENPTDLPQHFLQLYYRVTFYYFRNLSFNLPCTHQLSHSLSASFVQSSLLKLTNFFVIVQQLLLSVLNQFGLFWPINILSSWSLFSVPIAGCHECHRRQHLSCFFSSSQLPLCSTLDVCEILYVSVAPVKPWSPFISLFFTAPLLSSTSSHLPSSSPTTLLVFTRPQGFGGLLLSPTSRVYVMLTVTSYSGWTSSCVLPLLSYLGFLLKAYLPCG